jgi:hypothetical protein
MKNFIFSNQQEICNALYSREINNESIQDEILRLADEISCIGDDVEQLDYVMEEYSYLTNNAKNILKAVKYELVDGPAKQPCRI